ncbi:bifunctional metallophosphatase/5'-nucleotidase [Candidatus Contubernalis alkaliaceticus]|uniref:bifunctional metallophosphatase/5'-nucleotidase n=1 Tax=Candidatus Contubernalis alkaliaceticus TaxID=338645 RepID=UPI001F4BED9C|nr:5'-nucleotidase C-terminal domain-containing protein [Candidatus Contubernalis alkalaceticus]UNC90878.1 5'-nucleotidase C-terminal domain-containing protein [Candidatus Contubernalis alkalaceticus]
MKVNNLQKIDIYSINDFHGIIEPRRHYSAASVFSKLLSLKSSNPENTIIVSSGDMFESPALMNKSPGYLTIQLMNLVGTAAMTVGNHDFDWFPKRKTYLQEIQKHLDCPLISCNLYNKQTGKRPSFIKPSILIHVSGVNIAFIGLTTEECFKICLREELGDIQVSNSVSSLKKEIDRVKNQGADIIIGIGHIGAFQDNPGDVIRGETAELLKHFNKQDLHGFIAAHTHQHISGEINGIKVVQAGAYGEGIGHIEIIINPGLKEKFIINSREIKIEKSRTKKEIHPQILQIIQKQQQGDSTKTEKIGFTNKDLIIDYERETFWGRFVAEAMQRKVSADIGFINSGAFRAAVKAGDLFVSDIIQNLPFDNTVLKILLKGKVIKNILEKPINRSMGKLQTTGITKIHDDKDYTTAVSSFLAVGGDGYSEFATGAILEDTGVLVRDVVIDRIKAVGDIMPD